MECILTYFLCFSAYEYLNDTLGYNEIRVYIIIYLEILSILAVPFMLFYHMHRMVCIVYTVFYTMYRSELTSIKTIPL